jgi:hypothetical protein
MASAVDSYLALSPRELPYLRRLTLTEDDEAVNGPEYTLELVFSGGRSEELVVRCEGVRELTFRQPFTTDMRLHSLNVEDLSSSQLEEINFRVMDIEEEWLSFWCRTFSAERRTACRSTVDIPVPDDRLP